MIDPKFVMLIDVGTKPYKKSLCALYYTMVNNNRIAGVCGEIVPQDPVYLNIIEGYQVFEYAFYHIFDKALESCFGYISVMPGAFSAYRWKAINGEPLESVYFISIKRPEIMNCHKSNVCLAEDRLLPWAIVSMPGTTNILKFVHCAYAETGVAQTLLQLLLQRRRWINGSYFSLANTCSHSCEFSYTNHSMLRKVCFCIEIFYFVTIISATWFMVGIFYLVYELIFGSALSQIYIFFYPASEIVMDFYLGILIIIFFLSFDLKSETGEISYKVISYLLIIYMTAVFFLLNYITFSASRHLSDYTIFLLCAIIGSFAIGIIITGNLKKILFTMIQFFLFFPIYVNFFGIYSLCNTHNCSWGDRPEITREEVIMNISGFSLKELHGS